MKIHRNISINLALVIAGLILVFYLLSTSVILNEFTSLEQEEAQKSMDQVLSAYHSEIQDLNGLTRDWASWDDTYEFMDIPSSEYLESNLVKGTFVNNRLDLILYFSISGDLVYGKKFDYGQEDRYNLTDEELSLLKRYGLTDRVLQNDTGMGGLVNIADKALIVSAMPILTSNNQGPPRGVLVMGRYLNDDIVSRFEQLTSLPIIAFEGSAIPLEVAEISHSLDGLHPYQIALTNETWMNGYLVIDDMKGSPAIAFQVTMPRDFSLQGREITRYLFSLLIVVALIFGTIVMVILEKSVLSRIATLSSSVTDIGKSGDLSRRVPEGGDDEIASFSQEINRMLSALMNAENAISDQNRRLKAINDIISTVSHADIVDPLYADSLQKTIEILGFRLGMISILNLKTKRAELRAHSGIPPENVQEFLATYGSFDILHSPHKDVFTQGIPRFYEGTPDDMPDGTRLPLLITLRVQSLGVIPLTSGSVVLGAMYVGDTKPHQFSEYEREILVSIGKEVGNALFKGVLQEKLVAAMTKAEISNERAQIARDEANFYLDIMTHDINNVNQASLGYTMLLSDETQEHPGELVKKLENTIIKSSDIIRQVSVIRRIREQDTGLKEMDLDGVIQNIRHHFSDAHIVYEGSPTPVLADELIPEIFMNLIGNAFKFGGAGVMITMRVTEGADETLVTIQDNGPGIPDNLKPVLFRRYQKGSTSKSGKGLGLYIVRTLVERYGGRVWVEDAIPGHPESGAAIKFTLKRPGK